MDDLPSALGREKKMVVSARALACDAGERRKIPRLNAGGRKKEERSCSIFAGGEKGKEGEITSTSGTSASAIKE